MDKLDKNNPKQPEPDTSAPARYDEKDLLHGRQPLQATESLNEQGHSTRHGTAMPGRLNGTVSEEEVEEFLEGTMPATPASGRRDPLDKPGQSTPARVDPQASRREAGAVNARRPRPDDGDGTVYPETVGPNAAMPEYEAVHNDNSTPNYKDEIYMYKGQDSSSPENGDQPESTPKENTAY